MRAAVVALALAVATASGPEALVAKFCRAYLKQQDHDRLEGKDRRVMAPMLSARLLRQLDDARACLQDWSRQQPKGSTDKPPFFVDCCLFSSTPDGAPTAFTLGAAEKLPDGRTKVVINYVLKTHTDNIHWRDAAIVANENGRFVVDDFVYDLDRDQVLLSTSFRECRGKRWIGQP
jgi:hypothetical protein